jgi:acetyl esterase
MSQLIGRPYVPPIRSSLEDLIATRDHLDFSAANQNLPDVAEIHEDVVLQERPDGPLRADIFVPHGKGPFPAFLFLHGGAFYSCSPKTHRRLAMRFAEQGYFAVSVDYSLAPEHRFPRPVEECVYAARWLVHHAADYGGTASHVVLAGDSAGASMVAAAAVYLAGGSGVEIDEADLAGTEVRPACLLLLYGMYDWVRRLTSPVGSSGDVGLRAMAYLGPTYLRHVRNPLASPRHAPNLAALPPAYLSVGGRDALLGQSLDFAKALALANVPTTVSVVAGADHCFLLLEHVFPSATAELERIFAWLQRQLSG